MNIPLPDSGIPVQPGDDHFKYKGVYHPITWINDMPYRPRVETLVIMGGNMVYVRLKDDDKLGSSGNGESYELPGGSIDADSSPIKQAENEINEEALISVKNIYDTGIQYYADYPNGFLMNGGDTPLEYQGHISSVFVAEYNGIYDRNSVEEKDLDPKISENGKFYLITKVVPYLRQEHIDALLNSPYVKDSVKGAIRIINRKSNPLKKNNELLSTDHVVGELFFASKNANMLTEVGSKYKNNSLAIDTGGTSIIRVFNSIDEALTGYDSTFGRLKNGDTIYVYTIADKIDSVYTPTNQESPSSKITGELWIKPKSLINVKRLGLVRVLSCGIEDKYYYGKNSTLVGKIQRLKHEWVTKDVNSTGCMESSVLLPRDKKLYHGSTFLIEEFKPMSLDLGNAQQEPGWSTFTFADYTLALRFGLMRSIQKVMEYYKDKHPQLTCSWDMKEGKPWVTAKDFKVLEPLITNFKFYVYTIDASNLDVGLGNDDRFPEYTFRESGVIPEKTDRICIDATLLKENLHIIPAGENVCKFINDQERIANSTRVRGWYGVMMTKDYNNGLASSQLQKAVKDGKLKPGDDIALYMSENGIAFDDDSISMKEYVSEAFFKTPITESLLISKDVYDVNFEDFESGKSNIVLVTGLSGSGKSTLGKKIADKYKAELIELDLFEQCYIFENDDQLKEAGEVFYVYLSHNKDIWDKLKKKELHGDKLAKEIEKFLRYAISWCKKDKKHKYVLEGVQIYSFLNKEKINGAPIIFVGTSALKSLVRRLSRAREHSKEDFKNQLSELPQCIAWYIDENKTYEKFKKSVLEAAEYSSVNKYPVFIALMHTGTKLSTTIRTVTHDEFTHATISFNSKLNPLYSFGTKNYPGNDHGFVQQEPTSDFYRHYRASYSVYVMYVSKTQRDKMLERLQYFIDNSDLVKFDIAALVACALKIPTEFRKKFFCSRFCMEIIGKGIELDKVPSLWSPQQMSELDNISLVNKGDDFYKYDYSITEKNLKKIKEGKTDDILLESSSTKEKYYRVTYNGAGVYEAYKNVVGQERWNTFKKSPACSWLPVPPIAYAYGYKSYFNEQGLKHFKTLTLMELAKVLPLNMIHIEEVPHINRKDVVYSDYFQVVVRDRKHVPTKESMIAGYTDVIEAETPRSELPDSEFGLPNERKYPLDSVSHINSAIKFFNYVSKEDEEELASNIIKKINDYGMGGELSITTRNRLYPYLTSAGLMESLSETDDVILNNYIMNLPNNLRRKAIDKLSVYRKENRLYENKMYTGDTLSAIVMVYQDSVDTTTAHAIIMCIDGSNQSTIKNLTDDIVLGVINLYPHIETLRVLDVVSDNDKTVSTSKVKDNLSSITESWIPLMENNEYYKNIPLKTYNKIKKIHNSLSNDEKYYVGRTSVSKYTVYVDVRNEAYIILDDYNGKYTDKHPYQGKIISIAASSRSRGTGDTDRLIKDAIRNNRDSVLIAEIDKGNYYSENLFKRNGFRLIDSKDDMLFYGYSNNNRKVMESWVPLMEASDDDNSDDNATDYTAEADTDDSTDYTEEADSSDESGESEPQEEETASDYTEDANTEETEDTSTGDEAGGTEDELSATDYTDEAGSSDSAGSDDSSDTSSTSEIPRNGNLIDNNVLKNYSVLKNFEKLYNLTKEVSDSMDSVVMPTKLQNTVLAQALKNLNSIKEFILSYVKFQFSSDNYAQNLYYYNIVLQSLNLNLELLKRNRDLEETKNNLKKSRR